MKLLRISRKAFHVYSLGGRLRNAVMPDDSDYYNDERVCRLINRNTKRRDVIYARASTTKHTKEQLYN